MHMKSFSKMKKEEVLVLLKNFKFFKDGIEVDHDESKAFEKLKQPCLDQYDLVFLNMNIETNLNFLLIKINQKHSGYLNGIVRSAI